MTLPTISLPRGESGIATLPAVVGTLLCPSVHGLPAVWESGARGTWNLCRSEPAVQEDLVQPEASGQPPDLGSLEGQPVTLQ